METPDRVHVTNSGEDKLDNNWNWYKKTSTCPKLTLYLAENMVAHILWWLARIFMSEILIQLVFQLRTIQYLSKSRIAGVLGEEGLIVAWWCSASARPIFQFSVAVDNHARWSRIATGFFWIVYFNNGLEMAVIMITTKIYHMQNPLSKQHLNGWHHYRSLVWVQANICVPQSYKRS